MLAEVVVVVTTMLPEVKTVETLADAVVTDEII